MSDLLRRELSYFFSGLSFYTRIPCPAWVKFSADNLNKSRKYLPLIGLCVGVVAALVFYLCHLVLPVSVSIVLSMIATVYLTGAFHEDGLADCADGFGGGWEKSQILAIMKDSRLGAYGAIALLLIFALKFVVLWEIQQLSVELLICSLILGHALSRLMASLTMQFYEYVSELSTSKSQSVTSITLNASEMAFSLLPVIAVFMYLISSKFIVALVSLLVFTWFLAEAYKKRIGGYTGDCLGATQQLTEVLFYLVVAVKISSIGW